LLTRAGLLLNRLFRGESDSGLPSVSGGTLDIMANTRAPRRKVGFQKHHGLSLAAIGSLLLWVCFYFNTDSKTHIGSFFGNAIADWSGVVVTVIATKYFYEIGSPESRQPRYRFRNRVIETVRDHSLTIFLVLTGADWTFLSLRMDSEGKWGQVVGNIVSEWTQLLGLVLLTKRLIEENIRRAAISCQVAWGVATTRTSPRARLTHTPPASDCLRPFGARAARRLCPPSTPCNAS